MRARSNVVDLAIPAAIIALVALTLSASATSAPPGFVENKGQIHDQFRRPNPAVQYLLNAPGLNVQLRADGFGYDHYVVREGECAGALEGEKAKEVWEGMEAKGEPPTIFDFHRIDIRFVNGDPNAEIIAEGRSEDYANYYTDVTGEAGATSVRSYTTITYRNVWPNIDVRFNGGEEGFKYDVVVRAGGSLANARFEVQGAGISDNLKGELVFTWNDGTLNETIPDSWVESGRKRERVHATYNLKGDGSFGFDAPTTTGTLVIDPAIQWATYYGGAGVEGGANAAMDDAGNAYIAGETSSTNSIATAGSHDATYNGGEDGFIVKLTPACVRLWSTYFGGTSIEGWVSIQVNGTGTAVLTGYTFSTTGIATTGAHKTALTGTCDAFLMLFNPNGTRQWGTYYGGTSVDYGTGASLAMNGNVALVGETASSNGIATAGAPDATYGGSHDGFVAWFSPTGARLFGSYIGGTGEDTAWGVAAGFANSEFVVVGHTFSSTGIATTGSHDVSYNGGYDAFLALYNGSGTGTKTWCTYYGGPGDDLGRAVTYTSLGVFAMCGHTSSTTGIATANGDQPAYGGGTKDGFHATFDRFTKARIRGSYAGGANEDHVTRIAKLGNQGYAIGAPGFSAGQATPGSFNPNGPGRYVAGYTSSGTKNWSGYMPGSDLYSIGIGANSTAMVVVGANELGDATTTPGVHQPSPGGSWDLIVHRLTNTTPPMLMPLLDGPVRTDAQCRIMVVDRDLSVLPISRDASAHVLLRLMDATGRLLAERLWNGAARSEFPGLNSGAYVLVAQPQGGAPQAMRFVIP